MIAIISWYLIIGVLLVCGALYIVEGKGLMQEFRNHMEEDWGEKLTDKEFKLILTLVLPLVGSIMWLPWICLIIARRNK